MANNTVTLLLGEQMAVIFLGVNILFPLTFSALLASLILLTVQTNRFLERIMGSATSRGRYSGMEDVRDNVQTPVQTLQDTTKDKNGNSAVRKRRSSIVQTTEPANHTSFSDINANPATRKNLNSPSSLSLSGESQCSDRVSSGRKHKLGSSNQVSPISPNTEAREKQEISWAWTNQNRDKTGVFNRRHNDDRVLSPSQCQIETISKDDPISKGVFFDNDMKAYDIW